MGFVRQPAKFLVDIVVRKWDGSDRPFPGPMFEWLKKIFSSNILAKNWRFLRKLLQDFCKNWIITLVLKKHQFFHQKIGENRKKL
jgi:hypothetical protein